MGDSRAALCVLDGFVEDNVARYVPPLMNVRCDFCDAWHFHGEFAAGQYPCCRQRLRLARPEQPPALLQLFLDQSWQNAKVFRKHIRQFNNAFSFASYNAQRIQLPAGGPPTFNILGDSYHLMGPLRAPGEELARFAQIYFLDPEHQQDRRLNASLLDRVGNQPSVRVVLDILRRLIEGADNGEANRYYHEFKTGLQRQEEARAAGEEVDMTVCVLAGDREFSGLACGDVGVVMADANLANGEQGCQRQPRAIAVMERAPPGEGQGTRRVSSLSACYDSLTTVLFDIKGVRPSWSPGGIPYARDDGEDGSEGEGGGEGHRGTRRTHATCQEVCAHQLFTRDDPVHYPTADDNIDFLQPELFFNPERCHQLRDVQHWGGRLHCQYVCDCFSRVLDHRLTFIRQHQDELRADIQGGLQDALGNEDDVGERGRRVVLPASVTGSRRDLHRRFQDALSYVRVLGLPQLFVTVTANPQVCVL